MKSLIVVLVCVAIGSASSFAADPPAQIAPTYGNVSYGPHARNVLDLWKADGDGPRPLLVYIHGGGWTGGDKQQDPKVVQPFLDKGISYAAINYRLTPDNPLPAPEHDAARAIQFICTKDAGHGIHHPVYGVKLKEKSDKLGHECHLLIPGVSKSEKYANANEFLMDKLLSK